jgi:23S rRNA pseudouridine1911/1915/1917 synthase
LPEVKKSQVRQWLQHGAVLVNGRSTTQFNHRLAAGDVVSIRSKREALVEAELPRGMRVLFEDDAVIVIEKPAGLLSMASETERRKTAYAYLTDYVRRGDCHSRARVWIVHRLDREASGLMVFARTEPAKRTLQAGWREAEKRYLAVVEGEPPADEGVLESHLDESRPYKVHSAPPSDETRYAATRYRVLKRGAAGALVELTLETGRRNQIRVQLAEAGCPIVGDEKYGARTNPAGRLGLHASWLEFEHPSSSERLRFESPLPRELAGLV